MRILARALVLAVLFSSVFGPTAHASTRIVLDGQFDDWAGKAFIQDPSGDTQVPTVDVTHLYFAVNKDEPRIYFMAQRQKGAANIRHTLWIDTNNNGTFSDPVDAQVQVDYHPTGNVTVAVLRGGQPVDYYTGPWGEKAADGASRCEWFVSLASLGIVWGQVIRLVLTTTVHSMVPSPSTYDNHMALVASGHSDRVPNTGDLQWAPIPALAIWGNLAVVAFAGFLAYRQYYRHLKPKRCA